MSFGSELGAASSSRSSGGGAERGDRNRAREEGRVNIQDEINQTKAALSVSAEAWEHIAWPFLKAAATCAMNNESKILLNIIYRLRFLLFKRRRIVILFHVESKLPFCLFAQHKLHFQPCTIPHLLRATSIGALLRARPGPEVGRPEGIRVLLATSIGKLSPAPLTYAVCAIRRRCGEGA